MSWPAGDHVAHELRGHTQDLRLASAAVRFLPGRSVSDQLARPVSLPAATPTIKVWIEAVSVAVTTLLRVLLRRGGTSVSREELFQRLMLKSFNQVNLTLENTAECMKRKSQPLRESQVFTSQQSDPERLPPFGAEEAQRATLERNDSCVN